MRFLIIDSDGLDRARIARSLRQAHPSASLVEAGSRAAYQSALQDGDFDLVLTEHALPWTDGLTVLREVQARLPGVPVIMVTHSGSETLAVEGLKAGLSDYVPKHALERLPEAVHTSLATARQREQTAEQQSRITLESSSDMSVSVQDITEHQRLLTELRKRTRELETANVTLEEQAVELEEQAAELEEQAVELKAQNHELLRLERQLRSDRDLFQTIYDIAPVMITIYDPQIQQVTVNKHFARVTGWAEADTARASLMELVYPDPDYRAEIAAYMQSLQPGYRDVDMRTKSGEVIQTSWANVKLPDGRQVGIGIDITARKRVEQALQRSVAEFEALYNQMTEGLVLFDPQGRLLDMNPAALAIHGFETIDTLQRHLTTLTDTFELFDLEGNLLSTDEWPIGRVLRGETFHRYEVRVRRPDTGRTWIASYGGTPVYDPDGHLLLAIVTLRDITARHRSEQALRRNEAKLRAVFRALVEGVVFLNAQGEVEETNEAVQRLHGHTLQELADPDLDPRHRILYPDGSLFPEEEQPAIVALRTGQAVRDVEMGVPTADGTLRWRLVNAQPAYDDQGRLLGAVASFFDITDRKQTEQRQAFRVMLGERLRGLREPAAIMDAGAELLGRHLSVNRVGYAEVDETGEYLLMRDWTDGAVASSAGQHRVDAWGPELAAAYQRGEVWRVDDVVSDPRPGVRDFVAAYDALDIRAAIGVPLVRGGRWVALIFMTHNRPYTWSDAEIELLQDVAEHTWEAVERGRAEQALKRYVDELEALNETNRLLLREVNHRVKNNLTAILGLIFAEKKRLGAEVPAHQGKPHYMAALDDLSERVRSLATAHSLLSAGGWRPLSVSDLIEEVIHASAPVGDATDIGAAKVLINGPVVYITPEQAHHLALVIGELTTNTSKYGRTGEDMRISVDVGLDDGEVRVVYRNQGQGFPDRVLAGKVRSVGLGLVDTIVKLSLRGSWSIRNDNGAVTEIRFPVNHEPAQAAAEE